MVREQSQVLTHCFVEDETGIAVCVYPVEGVIVGMVVIDGVTRTAGGADIHL